MKKSVWMALGLGVMAIAGCATGRNYQGDIDSMNSKISVLENQLSGKDQEIARLQGQVGAQDQALARAESEKRELAAQMQSLAAKKSASSAKAGDEYLK